VLWSGETSFEYQREVQPDQSSPDFEALLVGTGPKTLTLIHVFEELRGSR
jgi:hypothetical protein